MPAAMLLLSWRRAWLEGDVFLGGVASSYAFHSSRPGRSNPNPLKFRTFSLWHGVCH
jgi:hypothetical protein